MDDNTLLAGVIPAQRASQITLTIPLTVQQFTDLQDWADDHAMDLPELALKTLLDEAHR